MKYIDVFGKEDLAVEKCRVRMDQRANPELRSLQTSDDKRVFDASIHPRCRCNGEGDNAYLAYTSSWPPPKSFTVSASRKVDFYVGEDSSNLEDIPHLKLVFNPAGTRS